MGSVSMPLSKLRNALLKEICLKQNNNTDLNYILVRQQENL